MDVISGYVAIKLGRYWVGVASGNRYCSQRRMTADGALADAFKVFLR